MVKESIMCDALTHQFQSTFPKKGHISADFNFNNGPKLFLKILKRPMFVSVWWLQHSYFSQKSSKMTYFAKCMSGNNLNIPISL